MEKILRILSMICMIPATMYAQDQPRSLKISDPSPPLKINRWLKGNPVTKFEKDHIYVVEFWATWCKPCIAAMPHLSEIARKYSNDVSIIGVDIYEKENTPFERIRSFVDSMGINMDYHVATEEKNLMASEWIAAAGTATDGIPRTFVIDQDGKLAWIGHPKLLEPVLQKLLQKKWSNQEALQQWDQAKKIARLDEEANYELSRFIASTGNPKETDKPDSALLMIDALTTKEPLLKYAPFISYHTFLSLLKTDPEKAYQYGTSLLPVSSEFNSLYANIINAINIYTGKKELPAKIYLLGIEALKTKIRFYPNVNLSNTYSKMAEWYWRISDRVSAIEYQQKSIEQYKKNKAPKNANLGELESQLKQYMQM